jgi:hypothetical protein
MEALTRPKVFSLRAWSAVGGSGSTDLRLAEPTQALRQILVTYCGDRGTHTVSSNYRAALSLFVASVSSSSTPRPKIPLYKSSP